ncbi:hypothetical protein AVEN_91074-1 [Araneus ventricosus]|uniref:Uncharacterized protein n=1 Tax=Araneus ventricosus TaxID=182803 RepID=A0A4Y2J556_ARAVE|nr:hypothetical protein AVEN_91074-1 [Araneus ventricosus]
MVITWAALHLLSPHCLFFFLVYLITLLFILSIPEYTSALQAGYNFLISLGLPSTSCPIGSGARTSLSSRYWQRRQDDESSLKNILSGKQDGQSSHILSRRRQDRRIAFQDIQSRRRQDRRIAQDILRLDEDKTDESSFQDIPRSRRKTRRTNQAPKHPVQTKTKTDNCRVSKTSCPDEGQD